MDKCARRNGLYEGGSNSQQEERGPCLNKNLTCRMVYSKVKEEEEKGSE